MSLATHRECLGGKLNLGKCGVVPWAPQFIFPAAVLDGSATMMKSDPVELDLPQLVELGDLLRVDGNEPIELSNFLKFPSSMTVFVYVQCRRTLAIKRGPSCAGLLRS
jgi:hypothetical protein